MTPDEQIEGNKTMKEILKQEYDKVVALHPEHNWGAWEDEHLSVNIGINAMTAYADQEKRNEAIGILEWVQKKGIENDCRGKWIDFSSSPAPRHTSAALYDHYLQYVNQSK